MTGFSGPPGERPLVWYSRYIGHSGSFLIVAPCPEKGGDLNHWSKEVDTPEEARDILARVS